MKMVYHAKAREALKKALDDLEMLADKANKADEAYYADPENIEKEAAFDAACKAEWNKTEEAAKLIANITDWEIDMKNARIIVHRYRRVIRAIIG